jgi:transitional endoplasmic reticulum ATPase
MDGLEELKEVVVIGATNRPDMLDPAILRPGRFDRLVLVYPPSTEGREEIFKIHTKKMPLASNVNIKELSEKTEGYVGADIESLCREAAMIALREDLKSDEVSKKNFEAAMKKVKPSVSKELMEKYKEMESEYLKSARAALEKPVYLG